MHGLIDSSEGRDIKDFKSWNEAMVQKYDPEAYHLRSNWMIRIIEKMRVHALLSAIKHRSGASALEVGCGAGNVLEQIPNGHLVGIDLSERMVRRTRERLRRLSVSVLQADAEQLPFSPDSFEEVLCTEVMEHVKNPDEVIREIWRISKPGARIAVSIPNEKVINQVKERIRKSGLGPLFFGGGYGVPERMNDEWHLHVFDLKSITETLSLKFRIRKITPIPSAFLPLRFVFALTPLK